MPEPRITTFGRAIGFARTLYTAFVYLLIGAGVIITAILIFAPRPEYGFPSSHPLTITTWSILSAAVVTVLLYTAYAVIEAIVGSVVSFVKWINGETTEESA